MQTISPSPNWKKQAPSTGRQSVIDLHGQLETVSCLKCESSREEVQRFLTESNPDFQIASSVIKPDGDANIEHADLSSFQIPNCANCDDILKPDVVFFGESVPRARVNKATQELQQSNGLLSIGTSLMVFSGYRFCRTAIQWKTPCAALNIGRTRADDDLALKVEANCGEALSTIVARLLS